MYGNEAEIVEGNADLSVIRRMMGAEYDGWWSGSFDSHFQNYRGEWNPTLTEVEYRELSRSYFDEALNNDAPDVELYYQNDKENLLVVDRADQVVVAGGTNPGKIQTMFKPDELEEYVDERTGNTLIRIR